ncbi:MAG TPA: hypothetical protein PK095_14690 [Myxococcota bacterium]|nr:hypothetical protein [Myxococcota bacterium]
MKRYLLSAALLAAVGFTACDGNDETDPTDTNRPDTTDTSDTTQPDTSETTQPDTTDTIAPPDTIEPSATVKYARTLVAQEPCSADFRNDIDPQSQLADVIVTTPVYEITAPAAEDPGSYGFYVADADGGAYSGILVVTDGPKPELAIGNVVDVSGQLMEAFCNAQVSNATVTKKSDGTAPTPLTQNASDLSQDAYEGMLVKVVDAEIEAATEGGQGKRIKGANLPIGFVFEGFIGLNNGTTYDITGVIRSTRFNGVEGFQLVPRGPSDVVLKNAPTNSIVGLQTTDLSKTCPDPNTQFRNGASGIQIEGVVVVPRYVVTAARPDANPPNPGLGGYVISDGSQSPYSGIHVTFPGDETHSFAVGDSLRLVGSHAEYFCNTQFSATSIEKIGGPVELPGPFLLDKTISAADLEEWEGVLVEVQGVAAGAFETTGVFAVSTDAAFKIDDGIMGRDAFASGAAIANKTLTSLRGVVRFSRGSYRISPRSASDWVIAE